MPQGLLLDQFGLVVKDAFGAYPYLVGSALTQKNWRDVDVRVLLSSKEYERWGLGDPRTPHTNLRWVSLVQAFSALGKQMTGLPIDFQIQCMRVANTEFAGKSRSSLGSTIDILRRQSTETDPLED